MIPEAIITSPVFHFINFSFKLVIIEIIEVGTKNIRFVPCAICWSFPKNKERHNISIVPPPIPIPETRPEIIPY